MRFIDLGEDWPTLRRVGGEARTSKNKTDETRDALQISSANPHGIAKTEKAPVDVRALRRSNGSV